MCAGCPTHSPVKATHLLRDSCPHCTVAEQIMFQLWAMLWGGILYIVRSFLVFNSFLLSWPLKASPGPVPLRPSLSGILWVEQRGVGQAGGDKDIAFSCTQRQLCPPPSFSPSHSQLGIHVRPLFLFFCPFPFIYSALGEELWQLRVVESNFGNRTASCSTERSKGIVCDGALRFSVIWLEVGPWPAF